MNKKTLYLTALALLFAACQTEVEMTTAPAIVGEVESQPNSRTVLSVDESGVGTISWKPADQIDVFFGTTRAQYTSQNTLDVASAVFMTTDMVGPNDITSTNIWGLYPSNSTSNCDGSSVKTTLPAAQKGVPDTFDDDLFIAAAHSTTPTLQFKNVCGSIRFSLYRDDIVSVVFKGNDNEDIAGDISISFVGGLPVATVVNGVKEITLTPKTGTTFAKDTFYHIVALPATLTQGFTMTFTTTSGATGTFNFSDKPIAIKRSIFGKKGNMDVYAAFADGRQPDNVIYYKSLDGKIVWPNNNDFGAARIVSNKYIGGLGVLEFDAAVTCIGDNAFSNNNNLTYIEIPKSVTWIGSGAFYYCKQLRRIVVSSASPPKLMAWTEFYFCPLAVILVPEEYYDTYLAEWKEHVDKIMIHPMTSYQASLLLLNQTDIEIQLSSPHLSYSVPLSSGISLTDDLGNKVFYNNKWLVGNDSNGIPQGVSAQDYYSAEVKFNFDLSSLPQNVSALCSSDWSGRIPVFTFDYSQTDTRLVGEYIVPVTGVIRTTLGVYQTTYYKVVIKGEE